jgi:alcohol dehydrogenase
MIAGDGAATSTQTKGTAMCSAPFKAYLIEKDADGKVGGSLTTLTPGQLDEGELTIRVHCSIINRKDALAATGSGKIIRRFPRAGASTWQLR